MSYSMWGVQAVAVNLDKYFDLLKKDIEMIKNNPQYLETLPEVQKKLFLECSKIVEEDTTDSDFYEIQGDSNNGYQYYDTGKYSENYAYATPINLETGKLNLDGDNFDGWIYEFSWGSPSIYKPEFENKESVLNTIKENLYIPMDFDLEHSIIFVSAVQGG